MLNKDKNILVFTGMTSMIQIKVVRMTEWHTVHGKRKSEDLIKKEVISNAFTSSACLHVLIHLLVWCYDSL
jgi:hypothetical protein